MTKIIVIRLDGDNMKIEAENISGPFEARIMLQQADQALVKQLTDDTRIEIIPPGGFPPFGRS